MTETEQALADLRWIAIRRMSGEQVGSDQLIDAGLRALLAGIDSPSLPLLAGLGRREEPEAPELFTRVVEELDLVPEPLPTDRRQTLWAMARWWAELIVQGELDPLTGGQLIWRQAAWDLDYPPQLQDIVSHAISGDDWNPSWGIPLDDIKAEIVVAAQQFLTDPSGATPTADRSTASPHPRSVVDPLPD